MNILKSSFSLLFLLAFLLQGCNSKQGKKESKTTEIQSENVLVSVNDDVSNTSKNTAAVVTECDCNVTAYAIKSPQKGIELFNEKKEVAERISFNEGEEEFLTLELANSKEEMFQIKKIEVAFAETANNKKYENLWIESKHLRVYLPDSDKEVNIYSTANEKSKVIRGVNSTEKYTIKIVKCCKKWIYGIYHNEKTGEQIEGWFRPEDICSSPLTNC